MKYPTIVVDNFFDNPNEIVEYSKTLDYYKADPTIPHSKWQGKRTESIHKINRQLYDFVISKALSYFFPTDTKKILYENTKVCFHKQGKEKGNLLNNYILNKKISFDIEKKNNQHNVILSNNDKSFNLNNVLINSYEKMIIIPFEEYKNMLDLFYNNLIYFGEFYIKNFK